MKTLDTIKTERLASKITIIENEIARTIGIGKKEYSVGCSSRTEYDYIVSALTTAGYKFTSKTNDGELCYTIIIDIA